MKRALVALIALAALALPPAAVAAGCVQTKDVDLEDEVMCPVCGMPLGLAREAPQARRERAFIARQIAACRSKDDIKAALVDEFGPGVLAEPPRGGFGATVYVVPLVAGGAVLAWVILALRRWRREAELERLR